MGASPAVRSSLRTAPSNPDGAFWYTFATDRTASGDPVADRLTCTDWSMVTTSTAAIIALVSAYSHLTGHTVYDDNRVEDEFHKVWPPVHSLPPIPITSTSAMVDNSS